MKFSHTFMTALLLVVLCQNSVHSQKQPPPFLVAVSEDAAYFVLLDPPHDLKGFGVERKGPGETDFIVKTSELITPVKDAVLFRHRLGEDYSWVARTVKGEHELQTLRRISTPANATALSLASTKVASALGRLFKDEDIQIGSSYEYRF